MEETIKYKLAFLTDDGWHPSEVAALACEIANALTAKGYGLLGFSGPSQITAFEIPIHPPVLHDCNERTPE